MISDEVEWQPRDNTVFRHEEIGRVCRKVGSVGLEFLSAWGAQLRRARLNFQCRFG